MCTRERERERERKIERTLLHFLGKSQTSFLLEIVRFVSKHLRRIAGLLGEGSVLFPTTMVLGPVVPTFFHRDYSPL